MKRLLCILRLHKWQSKVKWGHIEVAQCTRCNRYLNINHQEQQAYVTKDNGLLKDIEWFTYITEEMKKR